MHPLLEPLERYARDNPDRPVSGDQSLQLTGRQLAACAAGLAEQIRQRSDRPHVGILAPASTAGLVATFACYYAGRTPVPLNFLLSPEVIAEVARDAELDLLLTIEHFAELAAALGLPTLPLNADTLIPGKIPPPDVRADDLAALIYTSGTSGLPKGVELTFDNLAGNAAACIEHFRMEPSHVFLSVLPFFHAFGFTLGVLTPIVLGARVWHLPRFSPLLVAETIASQQVTIFPAVASMFAALCRLKEVPENALRNLTYPISGGEPLPASVALRFAERFGRPILEGYGLTETSPVASCNAPWARKDGSVGQPVPGMEIWAVDDDGKRLPADEEGELQIRGHSVMRGYRNRPEETAEVLRAGALRTGDVGRVDADGFVYITGRAKEMLIVAGENVFPREIEEVLCSHPAVAEAAVIGAPCELRGEAVVAFVIAEGSEPSPLELRSHCRRHLAQCKVPRHIEVCQDLPRGPTGKILKRALRPPTTD